MEAVVCSVDGAQYIRQRATAPPEHAAELGERMAQLLADGGARNILEQVQRSRG
jgi:porphobilinogen deaminase